MPIRLAKDEDFAAIARLHRQTIRNVNSKDYDKDIVDIWSSNTNAQKFRDSAHKCKRWVATENSKVVGFCDHGKQCELWGLYIHKDYIGKGIGSRLLKKAEESMKKGGCKKISIKSTLTAREFYEKHGYKVVKKDSHQIENRKIPIFIMEKPLPPHCSPRSNMR